MKYNGTPCSSRPRLRGLAVLLSCAMAAGVQAAGPTDIAQTPLIVTNAAQVKPNIMLLMDNSGSMGRTHMPDEVESVTGVRSIGYKSVQCNALYYNPDPAVTYLLPKRYDGSLFAAPVFTAARNNGFGEFFSTPDFSTTDLSSQFVPYDWGKNTVLGPVAAPTSGPSPGFAAAIPGPAFYYVYTGPETLRYDAAPCNQPEPIPGATVATPGGGTWTRVDLSTRPAAEQARFALWYSFYRTRLGLTKSAASLAFAPLDDNKRVGFITVEPKVLPTDASIDPSRYLPIGDFVTSPLAQKELWYRKLFGQVPSGASPTREGLARVGRYYGGETDGINSGMGGPDPVQYSCQQNFTILTTDGYWNGQTETPSGGGGVKLNRDSAALVGQQDGNPTCNSTDPYCVRPMYDGNSADIRNVTDKNNAYSSYLCTLNDIYRRTEQQQRKVFNRTRDTTRTQQETIQYQRSSSQLVAKSERTVKTVLQNQRTVDQYFIETIVESQDRYQVMRSQDRIERDTEQFQRQTRQETAQTLENTEVVTQTMRRDEKWQTASTQYIMLTTQFSVSTTRFEQGKQQVFKRQWQYIGTNGLGETSAPLPTATCPPGYTCAEYDSFPTALVDPTTCPVGSTMTGFNPDPTKSYVHTDCTTGPLAAAYGPVTACSPGVTPGTPDPARSGNSWVRTTCNQISTAAAFAPGYTVATCVASSQQATSPYTITKCTVAQNSSVPQMAACTPGAPVTSGSPDYITTQCVRPGATNYAAKDSPPCNEAAGPQTDASMVTTTCTKTQDQTNPAPPKGAGCTDNPGTSSPYLKVTCSVRTLSSTLKKISTCNPTTPAGNPWIKTACNQVPVAPTAAPTPVQWGTCVSGPNAGTYAYDTVCDTTGPNNVTAFVDSATCGGTTSSTPAAGSPWIDVFCTKPAGAANQTGVPWDPASGTCPTNAGTAPPYARSTCRTVPVSAPVAVDETTCTATTTSTTSPFLTTHCITQSLGGTFTCPGTVPTAFPWIYERCGYSSTYANAPYGSCTPNSSAGLAANEICRRTVTTLPAPSCVQDLSPSGTNPKITCSGWQTVVGMSGPAAPATCPAVNGPQGGPDHYDITCVTSAFGTYATPAGVAACPTPAMDPTTFEVTTCSNPPGTNFPLTNSAPCAVATVPGDNTNGWTTTQCVRSDIFVDMAGPACAATVTAQSGTGPEIRCVPNGGTVNEPVNNCSDPSPPGSVTTRCDDNSATAPWNNFGGAVCVPGNGSVVGELIDCRNIPVGSDVRDSSCAGPSGPDATGIIISCPLVSGSGNKYRVSTTTTLTRTPISGGTPSGPSVVIPVAGSPTAPVDVDGVCYASAPVMPSATFPAKPPVSIAGCAAWPCTQVTPSAGGSLNSLADVAQYYYVNDLRPLMLDNVPPGGTIGNLEDDTAAHQHMTTFTIALGVNGTLKYRNDYRTAVVGDFSDIRTGLKDWPVWPDPGLNYLNVDNYNNPKSIDDFWHTAVNGRGRYFNANNPTTVIQGLADALAKVGTVTAAGASEAVSTLTPTAGNNFVFASSYESGSWSGDLEAFTIDPSTGVLAAARDWSAQALLNGRAFPVCDNRKIFLMRNGTSLVDFAWNTDECPATGVPTGTLVSAPLLAAEMAHFSAANIASLSQFTAYLPGDPQLLAAQAPGALLNYIRGQRGNEDFLAGPTNTTRLFRKRTSVLGDLVGSQPVYVKQPFANYADAGYDAFKLSNAGRAAMVYVGGNDGMLHAFHATFNPLEPTYPVRGQEAWAVIPSTVLPNLYQLADVNYERGNHRFFVDGSPVAADVYDGTWHTILVGGLNAGGKGYYALDITNPAAPVALWEFKQDNAVCPATSAAALNNKSDCNLGLSYGKPVVTKLGTTWVVMFTSGYNNLNGAAQGDGQGFLYVVDAMTGATIHKIATGAGSSATPAGLAQINNYVDNVLLNNATLRAYGGDLLGNVWRFEFTPTAKAVLVGTAKAGATPQPITTRPELAELNGEPFVLVGTGKLLGVTDVTDASVQSVYGVRDKLSVAPSGAPPAIYPSLRGSLKAMTIPNVVPAAGAVRTISCTSNCAATDGWVIDLPEAGERVNVDMKLALGTLVFASNVPEGVPCSVGGHSWLNQIDFRTGQAVSTAPLSGTSGITSDFLKDSLNQGFNVIQLQPPAGNNNPEFVVRGRQGDATGTRNRAYVAPPPFVGKRISWREIVQ